MSINLCSVAVEPVDFVRDLGVILDSELSMPVYISKISSTCFFHLRRLRKLRVLIDSASAQRLVSAFILSRVDYCNAVLADLPTSTLAPLQRISKCCCPLSGRCYMAHTCQRYYEAITLASDCLSDSLQTLCAYVRRSQRSQSFVSSDTTTPISSLAGHRQLRSAMTTEYDIPRTRTKFGDRAFSIAGPREWNALSADIRNITDLSSLKQAIETYFFV